MTSSVLGNDTTTKQRVELHKASRRQGTYFIAATGVGKSTSLRHLILEDIKQHIGVCVFDPHGDLIDEIIGSLHNVEDRKRVILLDATDQNRVFGINLYQCGNPTDKELVTNAYERVEHIFKLVWGEDIATMPLVIQGIQNSAYTFIDSSPVYGCTMLEIPLLFRDRTARANVIAYLQDPDIHSWWADYYNDAPSGTKDELARMVVNKITGFTTNRLLRPIIGQSKSSIDFREVIDSTPGKIVLVKLDRNKERMTQLIGAMVIAQIWSAALSRRGTEKEKRRQFHIYCDEFEIYATDDFTSLLKECRKYGIGMTIAHQSREDISTRNKAASLQVANIIVGRVIPDDAKDIAPLFKANLKPVKPDIKPVYQRQQETYTITYWWPKRAEKQYDELIWERRAFNQTCAELLHVLCSCFSSRAEMTEDNEKDQREWTILVGKPDNLSGYVCFDDENYTHALDQLFHDDIPLLPYEETESRGGYGLPERTDWGYLIEQHKFPFYDQYIPSLYELVQMYPHGGVPNDVYTRVNNPNTNVSAVVINGKQIEYYHLSHVPLTTPVEERLLRFISESSSEVVRNYASYLLQEIRRVLPCWEDEVYTFIPMIYTDAEIEIQRNKEEVKNRKDMQTYFGLWRWKFLEHEDYDRSLRRIHAESRRMQEQQYALYKQFIGDNYTSLFVEMPGTGNLLLNRDLLRQFMGDNYIRVEATTRATGVYFGKGTYAGDWLISTTHYHYHYPAVIAFLKQEVLNMRERAIQWESKNAYYKNELARLLSRKKTKRVTEDKEWILSADEVIKPYFLPVYYEESVRISQSYKYTTYGDGVARSGFSSSPERTGVYHEEPRDEEQIANSWNRAVEELTRLPVGVAWCRVQNAAGEIEEHVVKLATSTIGVTDKKEMGKYIEEIKERMMKDGSLRSIADVEKEVSERHALLMQPPEPPILPGSPEPPPQLPPNVPKRKKPLN